MPEPNKPEWHKYVKECCKFKNMVNIQRQDKMLSSLLLRYMTLDI